MHNRRNAPGSETKICTYVYTQYVSVTQGNNLRHDYGETNYTILLQL